MQKNLAIPWAITSLRIGAAPFVLWTLSTGNLFLFLTLFIFSLITDLADGLVARRLKSTSRKGAYFDAIADFILIVGVFSIFAIQGLYPFWVLAIIVASFTQFMLTSIHRIQIYDLVGKYFGGLLYVIIIVTTALPMLSLFALSLQVIVGFFAISLASRAAYLGRLTKRKIVLTHFQAQNREVKL
jgi:phosphatidylglycerophosphate synthase